MSSDKFVNASVRTKKRGERVHPVGGVERGHCKIPRGRSRRVSRFKLDKPEIALMLQRCDTTALLKEGPNVLLCGMEGNVGHIDFALITYTRHGVE